MFMLWTAVIACLCFRWWAGRNGVAVIDEGREHRAQQRALHEDLVKL